MEGPHLAEVIQHQQDEIQCLQQELEAVHRHVPAPGPEAVTLPQDGDVEDYRIREAILRSVPKFLDDGKLLYCDHEVAVQKFLLCRIAVVQSDNFKKTILLESLAGKAVSRIRDNAAVDECYWNRTYEQFLDVVRELFCPDSESMLVCSEFQNYFQEKNQDVQSYLTNKCSLYKLAFGPNEHSFNMLMLHVIRGLCNHAVRRQVRRANPKDEAALRVAVVEATAAERDAYNGGYRESASLMDLLRSVQPGEPWGTCLRKRKQARFLWKSKQYRGKCENVIDATDEDTCAKTAEPRRPWRGRRLWTDPEGSQWKPRRERMA